MTIKLEKLTQPKMTVAALTGSRTSSCIKECIVLSIKLGIPIELNHNERIYCIDPKHIVDSIYMQCAIKENENEKS